MKYASTALSALAVALATPAVAQTATTPAATPETATAYPLTPEGAAQFVAAAEADLRTAAVDEARIAWVNATYITEDTDAMAARRISA